MNEPGKTYHLALQALPGLTEADAVLGLRALLKTALRCHGLKCTSVSPLPMDRTESPVTHDKGTP